MIARHVSLSEACASGQLSVVSFLIDLDDTDLDALSPDGISPLCAAATWGFADIVQLLLDAGCDPNVRNSDRGQSTALHSAACQEHGKIVHLLLQAGADGMLVDGEGRTAADFASVSDALWPLFTSRGLARTPKDVLVVKGIIRKLDPASEVLDPTFDPASAASGKSEDVSAKGGGSALPFYSRPGSAYVRADVGPISQSACGSSSGDPLSLPPLREEDCGGGVDPLEHMSIGEEQPTSEPRFSLWRDG